MFYLYGEAAGCPPVPSLLQALLFQLYPGEFAWFSLFFQRFELKTELMKTFLSWSSKDSIFSPSPLVSLSKPFITPLRKK